MGYEYKEEILLDIGPEPNCNYESESNRYYDKIDELDHVYAQVAKADEYEAKAKAYDAIAINIKALRKHMLNSGESVNAKIIETENTIKHIEAIIERTDTDV